MVKANKLWEKIDKEKHKFMRVTRGLASQEQQPPSVSGAKGLGERVD